MLGRVAETHDPQGERRLHRGGRRSGQEVAQGAPCRAWGRPRAARAGQAGEISRHERLPEVARPGRQVLRLAEPEERLRVRHRRLRRDSHRRAPERGLDQGRAPVSAGEARRQVRAVPPAGPGGRQRRGGAGRRHRGRAPRAAGLRVRPEEKAGAGQEQGEARAALPQEAGAGPRRQARHRGTVPSGCAEDSGPRGARGRDVDAGQPGGAQPHLAGCTGRALRLGRLAAVAGGALRDVPGVGQARRREAGAAAEAGQLPAPLQAAGGAHVHVCLRRQPGPPAAIHRGWLRPKRQGRERVHSLDARRTLGPHRLLRAPAPRRRQREAEVPGRRHRGGDRRGEAGRDPHPGTRRQEDAQRSEADRRRQRAEAGGAGAGGEHVRPGGPRRGGQVLHAEDAELGERVPGAPRGRGGAGEAREGGHCKGGP
mmetsp:Transcript_26519/g.74889  ORF Transcript_26519/g.74889 Transcript_26519/m.74889 type:complete len:426 (-) Transcript_26519:685-1962(-)